MGKIYKILSETDCNTMSLAEAQKKAEAGILIVPKQEASLAISGGAIQIQEVKNVETK